MRGGLAFRKVGDVLRPLSRIQRVGREEPLMAVPPWPAVKAAVPRIAKPFREGLRGNAKSTRGLADSDERMRDRTRNRRLGCDVPERRPGARLEPLEQLGRKDPSLMPKYGSERLQRLLRGTASIGDRVRDGLDLVLIGILSEAANSVVEVSEARH